MCPESVALEPLAPVSSLVPALPLLTGAMLVSTRPLTTSAVARPSDFTQLTTRTTTAQVAPWAQAAPALSRAPSAAPASMDFAPSRALQVDPIATLTISPASALPQFVAPDLSPTIAPSSSAVPSLPTATLDVGIRPMTMAPNPSPGTTPEEGAVRVAFLPDGSGGTNPGPGDGDPGTGGNPGADDDPDAGEGDGDPGPGSDGDPGSGGGGDSGCGPYAPQRHPTIWSDTLKGKLIDPETSKYIIPSPVSIGSMMRFKLDWDLADDDPQNTRYTSIQWEGGSSWSKYMSNQANSVFKGRMRPWENNKINGRVYEFIVDYSQAHFSVKVTVEYKNNPGQTMTATYDFDVERPEAVLSATLGSVRAGPRPDHNDVGVYLANGDDTTNWPDRAGMKITATTTAAPNVRGEFMFLQLIRPERTAADFNGKTYHGGRPDGDTWALDNSFEYFVKVPLGFKPVSGALGYPFADDLRVVGGTQSHSWIVDAGAEATRTMGDVPFATVPTDFKQVQVGSPGPSAVAENFITYVMWKPSSYGVWIGVAKIEWRWGGGIQRNAPADPWPTVPTVFVQPTASNPVNAFDESTPSNNVFPSWSVTSRALLGWG